MSDDLNKTIFVTGGTGLLGSYLLRYLVQKGYTNIRALKRPSSTMDLVAPVKDQIEWIEGDILDLFLLEDAMHEVQQVYHCAAIVSFDPRHYDKMTEINQLGTENIVNAALYKGIEKLVHVSSIAAIGRTKKEKHISEKSKWSRTKFNTQYAISKYLAEQEVWRGIAEGLNAAIINPSLILGSGHWHKGFLKLFKMTWKNFPFYPPGTTGFVDVRDVARIMIILMEKPIVSERFIISAENMSFKQLQEQLAFQLNRKAPTYAVNSAMRELAWRFEWLRSQFSAQYSPLITRDTAMNSSRTYFYHNEKSIEQLNFQYTPLKYTIEETAKQFLDASKDSFKPKFLPLI